MIEEEVNACDILLAVIGNHWLDMRHTEGAKSGQRRVDDLTDFVRLEIETALERNIPVIPVLVDRATMPAEADLPEPLQPLVYRGAAEVRAGRDRQIHINRFVSGIEAVIEPPQPNPSAETIQSDVVVQSSEPETVAHEVPPSVDSSSTISPLSDSPEPSSPSSETPTLISSNWQRRRPAVLALLALLVVGIGILAAVKYRPTPEPELSNLAQSSGQPGERTPAAGTPPSVGEPIPPQEPAVMETATEPGPKTDLPSLPGEPSITQPAISSQTEPPIASPKPERQEYTLTIIATPEDSTVRIMNIVPPYKRGLALVPGPYDVLVEYPGYQASRQWVTLPKSDLVVRVDLEKIPAVSVAASLPKTYTNSIGMEFVLIPAGTFMMGSSASDQNAQDDEKPAHEVIISKPFYMGKYEVTQAEWEKVMGTTIQAQRKKATYDSGLRGVGADYPVYYLSWEDAQAFIEKLKAKEGSASCRLPTEAEWEYAARAGNQFAYSFGDDSAKLDEYAWYSKNSDGKTHPVGTRQPNTWGLYDMHGNVWEWVQDGKRAYTVNAVTDPKGSTDADAGRVIRGGSWDRSAQGARSANRVRYLPGDRDGNRGFRCLSSGPSQ